MEHDFKRNLGRARTALIIFLIIFSSGRLTVWMRRPVYPPQLIMEGKAWPPANETRIVNAVDSPVGGVHLFGGGTTIAEALDSMKVRTDPHRAGVVLPRASILEITSQGWTVRAMTQSERWIWQIPMDLNFASSDDLQRIPGIGPVLARRIARYVSERVWVPAVDSLLQVNGVGPSKLESMKKYLEVEGYSE